MGVNLFIEGYPDPWVVRIRFPKNIDSFDELKGFAQALVDVNKFYEKEWAKVWESHFPRARRDLNARIISLDVKSPPILDILTDPAWLAVMIALLSGYGQIKSNVIDIRNDIASLIGSIKGLTSRELKLLEIAVLMTLERGLGSYERLGKKHLKMIERLRKRLLKDDANPNDKDNAASGIEISVKKLRDWNG